jgi:hypothetical protein
MVSALKMTLAMLAVMPRMVPNDAEASDGIRDVASFSRSARWYLCWRSATNPVACPCLEPVDVARDVLRQLLDLANDGRDDQEPEQDDEPRRDDEDDQHGPSSRHVPALEPADRRTEADREHRRDQHEQQDVAHRARRPQQPGHARDGERDLRVVAHGRRGADSFARGRSPFELGDAASVFGWRGRIQYLVSCVVSSCAGRGVRGPCATA